VFAMSEGVDQIRLSELFKNIHFIQWNATFEDEPKHWKNDLWNYGFGCSKLEF
jgi:hypothetical protein